MSALDSRAQGDNPLPSPHMHEVSIPDALAAGEHQTADGAAAGVVDLGVDPQVAFRHAGVGGDGHLDGPDEAVPLLAGVLAGVVGEVTDEGGLQAFEALVVVVGDPHGELVGGDDPADAHLTAVVHLPDDAPPDLDWLQPAPERLGESALHEPLEPTLELLQPHGGGLYPQGEISIPAPAVCAELGLVCPSIRASGGQVRCDDVRGGCMTPRCYADASTRASGGIGRRAGFRCL